MEGSSRFQNVREGRASVKEAGFGRAGKTEDWMNQCMSRLILELKHLRFDWKVRRSIDRGAGGGAQADGDWQ